MMVLPRTIKLLTYTAFCSTLFFSGVEAKGYQTNMARLQAMDKITGRVSKIDVPVNGEVRFGSFSIVVRSCVTRPPEETPENTAFVDVVDDYDSDNPINIFKGWMFSSSPALNAVEHPIYDVWLLRCYDDATGGKKILTAQELRDRDDIKRRQPKESSLKKSVKEEFSSVIEDEKKDISEPVVSEEVSSVEEAVVETENVEEPIQLPTADIYEEGAPKSLFPIRSEVSLTDDEQKETIPETDLKSDASFLAGDEELVDEPIEQKIDIEMTDDGSSLDEDNGFSEE